MTEKVLIGFVLSFEDMKEKLAPRKTIFLMSSETKDPLSEEI